MPAPKILVIPGSLRTGSYNVRLAALATKELALAEADVTRISLADYPLPLYDADLEAKSGPPHNAVKLKQHAGRASGHLHREPRNTTPRCTPLLKNTIDWISRVRERGEASLAAFKHRVFALGAPRPRRSAACIRCWRCGRCWRSAAARWSSPSRSTIAAPTRRSTTWTISRTQRPARATLEGHGRATARRHGER